ncbi:MAG: ATPase [Deltaproteobacteria bacterium]|nr:MAG: ATPase [Deltaproteobacteria bacterium]
MIDTSLREANNYVMPPITIVKHSGEEELFSEEKLLNSLARSGAGKETARSILKQIKEKLYPGIKTREIYKMANKLLRKKSRKFSVNYSLKNAILKLGPTGFYFERFVSHMYQAWGYETEVDVNLKGRCVSHEVDVIAKRADKTILVECKFHNTPNKKNDIKTVLYIQSRRVDLHDSKDCMAFDEFHVVSNTTFSKDAIEYSNCMGLNILGLNSPGKEAFHDVVRKYDLHPVTCLKRIRQKDMDLVLEEGIVLCKEILLPKNKQFLKKIGLTDKEVRSIVNEIKDIMEATG